MTGRAYHPITDGDIDRDHTVTLHPHAPGQTEALHEQFGGTVVETINGGPVLVLPGNRPCAERLVGLGDAVLTDGDHTPRAVPGGQVGARYWPADVDEAPPAD